MKVNTGQNTHNPRDPRLPRVMGIFVQFWPSSICVRNLEDPYRADWEMVKTQFHAESGKHTNKYKSEHTGFRNRIIRYVSYYYEVCLLLSS